MLLIRSSFFSVFLLFFLPNIFSQSTFQFPTSSPEEAGISSSAILSFIERAEKEIDALHSFMILRHGKLVSQGWWAPYNPSSPHTMHSLSKSFTSTAIGLAIAEGNLSLDDQVISFFPEQTPDKPSNNLKAMRIRDLITMNTGHLKEPRLFTVEGNWVKAFLAAEVGLKPGTHFRYNSAATYMLSAIIQKVSGEKLVDYLDSRFFQPLEIEKPDWDLSPDDINTGGWGLHIKTEDIAKLGQLYLQKGVWNGKRILSEEWVEMATARQTANGSNPESDWEQGYGFQFWRSRHNSYRGDGAMGQFCIVMPEQDAVIAITSGTADMGHVMNVVWEELLPAMKESPLPANDSSATSLQQKLSTLSLPIIKGEMRSPISKKISRETFSIADNQAGVKAIYFNIDKEDHSLAIDMVHGIEHLPIGKTNFAQGKMSGHFPFADIMRKPVAANGAWIKPDTYQVIIYFYESPARITYTFQFGEDELVWDSKLEHSLLGSKEQEQLISKKGS